jgi:hypothetical protein
MCVQTMQSISHLQSCLGHLHQRMAVLERQLRLGVTPDGDEESDTELESGVAPVTNLKPSAPEPAVPESDVPGSAISEPDVPGPAIPESDVTEPPVTKPSSNPSSNRATGRRTAPVNIDLAKWDMIIDAIVNMDYEFLNRDIPSTKPGRILARDMEMYIRGSNLLASQWPDVYIPRESPVYEAHIPSRVFHSAAKIGYQTEHQPGLSAQGYTNLYHFLDNIYRPLIGFIWKRVGPEAELKIQQVLKSNGNALNQLKLITTEEDSLKWREYNWLAVQEFRFGL